MARPDAADTPAHPAPDAMLESLIPLKPNPAMAARFHLVFSLGAEMTEG